MAHARSSMYLPPDINPAQAAIAYGCRALPKLNEELQSEDLLTRQKALMALCDLMHDPEHVYVAIDIGCLESLKALLKDNNDMVRIKTTEVLYIMATHNGREGFLEHDVILALSYLLNDPQPACRKNLHLALKHLAQLPSGAQGIVKSGLIPLLVSKLQREEEEEIQGLLLDTLAACLMVDATEALSSGMVPFLKQKLLSANGDIRSKAARTLIAVSIPLEGKKQVWQHDVIPILVHLLKDKVEEVQANAAGVLMYAAVTTQGKYAALDAEAIHPLLNLLGSSLSSARLNATKALTMLAEAPEGRKFLQSHVPIFRTLEEDPSEAVRRAAQIAIKVIEWKP
ncbi:radial spoke head 14 homolog [Ursus americanus]|uniref:Radial spoke head 14 homolog n=1 Tax=Ursus maritimus TaxID=29073 RepID=A0A384CMS2_URSMA|nr:radial spoke head 14 homolog [Ursus maritimus]XP_026343674.2 radial spoke head 14 homolog [Ursus arctos]XP_045658422.1 radial spoke head 14 homolog [Ursus americanus]XP_057162028.1 radial spoke head 14 homolog [Ursus arctos]XP_057162029.1 radial spoke head 14 homolog [Ursus arctos]